MTSSASAVIFKVLHKYTSPVMLEVLNSAEVNAET